MRVRLFARLCAGAIVLSGTTSASAQGDPIADIQKQIDELKKQGGYKVNTGSLAIESWLLTSTAIDSTATKIADAVRPDKDSARSVLVIAGNDQLDFGQVAMLGLEIKALTARLQSVCRCGQDISIESTGMPAIAGAIVGLLKSDTELTAIDQTVDPKLLAAAVAVKLKATLPSAAIAADDGGALISAFNKLAKVADLAQAVKNGLANKDKRTAAESDQLASLTALLTRYDSFYTRVTTPNATGVVPLAAAARLQQLISDDPLVLRVNTEKAGGTLLKRTNVVTALGGESTFISGGLVSSYQLTDPATGKVLKAGVITCRTTLTSLKRVQEGSWKAQASIRTLDNRIEPAAICSP